MRLKGLKRLTSAFQSFSIYPKETEGTEKTDEIERTEEAGKYLSIFFNLLNPLNQRVVGEERRICHFFH